MRLTDADATEQAFFDECKKQRCDRFDITAIISLLNEAPTIAPPPNDPLTLKELREMDGEPVYIIGRNISQYDVYCGYAINGVEQFYKAALPSDSYGKTWLAYRRKPEEVEA